MARMSRSGILECLFFLSKLIPGRLANCLGTLCTIQHFGHGHVQDKLYQNVPLSFLFSVKFQEKKFLYFFLVILNKVSKISKECKPWKVQKAPEPTLILLAISPPPKKSIALLPDLVDSALGNPPEKVAGRESEFEEMALAGYL